MRATRSEAGIVWAATASGEMCATALDAEHSALFARLAIDNCVRWPMLETRKPKHSVSLSKSDRCQVAAAQSHGLAVGEAEEDGSLRPERSAMG